MVGSRFDSGHTSSVSMWSPRPLLFNTLNTIATLIHTDLQTLDVPVPSLILQPLVENAIRHGRGSDGQVNLTVRIQPQGDEVVIAIADEGPGMSEGAWERGGGHGLRNVNERLREMIESKEPDLVFLDIQMPGLDGFEVIEEEEVLVRVGDESCPIRRTLSELEARLDPARFFRAHRSAIVNLNRIQEIIPWFRGSHKLRLTTGAELDLSRRQARALCEILRW